MSFTGNPGSGKTTVALRMAELLHRLGYVRKGHLVTVTRDDLVGQYIGHTAPKTKEVLKKAMGGVLFIDEAYYLYRPENERDYGQEAIEILLQVMENNRDDLVVIVAGYADKMARFFEPIRASGRASRIISSSRTTPTASCSRSPRRCWPGELSADRGRAPRSPTTSRSGAPSRISRTRARSATRSAARGSARRTGCSDRPTVRSTPRCSAGSRKPTSAPAGCSTAGSTPREATP